jgi:esterase
LTKEKRIRAARGQNHPRRLSGLTIMVLCALSAPLYAAPKWPLPDGIKSVEVNGYDMAFQEAGSGPPLVLVHGALVDYRSWFAQVSDFAKKYHVIAVSLRHSYPEKWDGHGDDFSIEQQVSDIAALISKLNIGPVNLLGHSRGGAVALNVAKEHPELIKTLILADPSGMETLLPPSPDNQKMAAETKALIDTLKANLASGDLEKGAREFTDSLGGPGTWAKRIPEQKQWFLDNIGTAVGDTGQRPPTTCEQIKSFGFPILLLNGERSPKRYGEMMAAMRSCERDIPAPVVIPNAAHAMNRDNPAAFNAVVLEFLDRN